MNTLPSNTFKRAIARDEKQVGLWLTLESTVSTEVAAGAGFDWMLLDMEHTSLSVSDLSGHILAARGGTAELVVRIPSIDPTLVKRLLDTGVRSFMFPFVQTAEEADIAIRSTRYPPHGIRGVSGNSRANRFTRTKDYLATYADDICVILQVESPDALAAIPAMGEFDGLDAIFIGPNDLAANMGLLGQPGAPEVQAAIANALRDIKRTGKAAGLLDYAPASARAQLDVGFAFVAVGSDTSLLVRGTDMLRAEFKMNKQVD